MTSPLDSTPDSCAQRMFLRAIRKAGLERLALAALLKAHRLLSLVLAQRLVEMRSSDDPLHAALAKAEAGALLSHVLREAIDILGDRIDKLPERRRPHYTPVQRFRILALKNLAGLTQPEAAQLFRVAVGTVGRWEATANPGAGTVGSTVKPVPPVRRYADTVQHLVQSLAGLGLGGSRSLVQHLARAGWRLGKTSALRYLRAPRPPRPVLPQIVPTAKPDRPVQAHYPHHVWHLDLTEVQGFFRSASFSLAVVLDGASRLPLSWRLFVDRPCAADMVAFVEGALARHGKPRHLIVDRDGVFTAHDFREHMAAWRLNLRFCSAENHHANSRLERFWRALKHDLLRLTPPREALSASDLERDVERALRYYAEYRPHQGLRGATPAEAYLGLEPAHLRAVQPPRGRPGDPPVPYPVAVDCLDGDRRFPFLRKAA